VSGRAAPRPALLVVLTGLVAVGPVSTDLYLPSLPRMTEAFDTSVGAVQLTLSAFLAGFALAMLIHGPLSDRFGRRPVLLGGLTLYVAASGACLVAPGMPALIGARFVQALGACAGPVVGRAVVRDLYDPKGAARALSFMSSAMALAPLAAPILGGWLHTWFGWQANFAALVLFGTALLVAALALLPETNTATDPDALDPGRMAANYRTLLAHPGYLGHTLCVAFAFGGLFAFISGASFVFVDVLGVAPENFGFCFATVVAGYVAGTFGSGRWGGRIGHDHLLRAGTALQVAAGVVGAGLAWYGVPGVAPVLGPLALFFLGTGFVLPNAMAGALAPFPAIAGAASALLGFLQMTVGGLAGAAVGHLHDGTTLPMTATIAAMAVAAFILYRAVARRGLAAMADSR